MINRPVTTEENWRTDNLTRDGQESFWNRQVAGYAKQPMTTDNGGELDLVRALCRQFCTSGSIAEDIVTLGGAVGSRDPLVISETLGHGDYNQVPRRIYFNDLSSQMVDEALNVNLRKTYSSEKTEVITLPGPIHEIIGKIPRIPRRIIIGVYRVEAFVTENPHHGYPLTGLDEYRENAHVLGSHLAIEPVCLASDGTYATIRTKIRCSTEDSGEQRSRINQMTAQLCQMSDIDAIRVVGRHQDWDGFFLSHWFSELGIRKLIQQAFPRKKPSSISIMSCAKGFVVCIDPDEKPRGIVTILNNVVGNILPNEQAVTLRLIDSVCR